MTSLTGLGYYQVDVFTHEALAGKRKADDQNLIGLAGRRIDEVFLHMVDPGIRKQRDVEFRSLLGFVCEPQAWGNF